MSIWQDQARNKEGQEACQQRNENLAGSAAKQRQLDPNDFLDDERRGAEALLESEHLYRNVFDVDALEAHYRELVLTTYRIGKLLEERIRHLPSYTLAYLDREVNWDAVYPPCIITKHDVNGIPAYQLSYEGMLPLYFEKDPKIIRDKDKLKAWTKYHQAVRDQYHRVTVDAARLFREHTRIPHAFMYHLHFFGNLIIRDLDNRNRSVLINALRAAGFLCGDDWKNLSTLEEGVADREGKFHVEVFLISQEYRLELVKYVQDYYKI